MLLSNVAQMRSALIPHPVHFVQNGGEFTLIYSLYYIINGRDVQRPIQ